MSKKERAPDLRSTLAAAVGIAASSCSFAASSAYERCQITDAQGKSLIREGRADCKTSSHGCATYNATNDRDAWVYMPTGLCERIEGARVLPQNYNE